jgi:CspA family cold shock protein
MQITKRKLPSNRRNKMNGKIKWYNARKGYGFIEDSEGKDIFVHRTSIPQGVFLKEGDEVEFETEETDKGVKAINVKKV